LLRGLFATVCRLALAVFVGFTISVVLADVVSLRSARTASATLANISPALIGSGGSGSSDGVDAIA